MHRVNTALRLFVLIPAAAICVAVAFLAFGFGGLNIGSSAMAIVIAGTPLALIAWTVADYRKRNHKGR